MSSVDHVAVRILHPEPGLDAGPLEHALADARREAGERHVAGFRAAGADDIELIAGPPDDTSFGERLRSLVAGVGEATGLVVLGSGSIPLATVVDRRAFVATARGDHGPRAALANNRYSADVIAIARPRDLPPIPDLPGDNALPRWLSEVGGRTVDDLRRRWRLQVDLDGPLDVELAGPRAADVQWTSLVRQRLAGIRAVARDRSGEILVAGRTSAATLRWLETHTACRVRALVEERGLRASSRLALGAVVDGERVKRPPRSVLGTLLDRDGPASLGVRLAELADAALVDTRVLLAHRLGADEGRWPSAEDRFASDLLFPDRIADGWLRELTASAAAAPIPIVLGGHTLVGPGVRLALRERGRR